MVRTNLLVPTQGGKYSVYEGGTRTPFITWWPGRITPAVSDEIVSTIDLPASMAALAGVELQEKACLDSFDVLGALLGEGIGRDHIVQQDNGRGGNYGLRVGDWKLQRHDSGRTRNLVVTTKLANTDVAQYRLFNLATDPAERNNLAAVHPEVFEEMKARLESIIENGRSRL